MHMFSKHDLYADISMGVCSCMLERERERVCLSVLHHAENFPSLNHLLQFPYHLCQSQQQHRLYHTIPANDSTHQYKSSKQITGEDQWESINGSTSLAAKPGYISTPNSSALAPIQRTN